MIELAAVVGVALVCAAVVAALWLQQRERAIVRAELRDERDTGTIADLRKRMDACEKEVSGMRTEQKTFLANARQR